RTIVASKPTFRRGSPVSNGQRRPVGSVPIRHRILPLNRGRFEKALRPSGRQDYLYAGHDRTPAAMALEAIPQALWFSLPGVLAFASLLGDLAGAFFKRRMHKPRGAKAPALDQYDFVAGALLMSLTIHDWSVPRFFSSDAFLGLVAIILITPALHRAVNVIGFRIGQKREPW